MAGLAGHMPGVLVQMMIDQFTADMGAVRMTIFAGKISFYRRNRNAAAGYHVIAGFVAVLAQKIHGRRR